MSLAYPVADPVKAHIHSFGATLFYGVVGDSGGAGVVSLDGRCCLGMSHVSESVAEHGGFLSVVEKGTSFGFSGG